MKNPVDDIDKLVAKRTLRALIYGTAYTGPMAIVNCPLPKNMPPTFLAAGGLDPISTNYPQLYKMLKDVGD